MKLSFHDGRWVGLEPEKLDLSKLASGVVIERPMNTRIDQFDNGFFLRYKGGFDGDFKTEIP